MYCCWIWHGRNYRPVFLKVGVSKTTCLMWENLSLTWKYGSTPTVGPTCTTPHTQVGHFIQRFTPQLAGKMKQTWRCIFLQRMGIFHECNHGFFGVHRCAYIPTVVFSPTFPSPLQPGIDSSMRAAFVSWSEVGLSGKFHSAAHLDDKKMTLRKGKEGKVDQEISFRGLFT